jgi:hypothetical protein
VLDAVAPGAVSDTVVPRKLKIITPCAGQGHWVRGRGTRLSGCSHTRVSHQTGPEVTAVAAARALTMNSTIRLSANVLERLSEMQLESN